MIGIRAGVVAVLTLFSAALLAGRLVAAVGKDRQEKRTLIGTTLADLLQRLGPTFVKCGQILATRWDLLPSEIINELQKLQDTASPLSFAAISRGRQQEFGFDIIKAFAQIDNEPLASGSVSCVYRCLTQDGRRVALKIRRPKICRIVGEDVACLRALAPILGKFWFFRNVPVVAVVDAVCNAIEQQLDFERELRMLRRLRDVFIAEPTVVLPKSLDALCGPAIITMELLDQFLPVHRRQDVADGRYGRRQRRGSGRSIE